MAAHELTLPPIGARLRELARRLGAPVFWSWWTHELTAAMPAAPRTAMERRRMRPVLVFAGDHATLWRPSIDEGRPTMQETTTIGLTGDAAAVAAAGRAALATLASLGPAVAPRLIVSLSPQEVLRKKLVLPAAVEENFRQALTYDLDRHTPFKSEELYFDAAIVDRNSARSTITIDLASARRAAVDPALKHVAAWGGEVTAVVPEPPERAASSRLNLLPLDARPEASMWRRWQFWVPLAVLAVMALAAVVIPLWQKREYVQQLDALTDQARNRAAVSETLRTELNARVGDYNFALERKYGFPGALQVIDTVSKLLPDDTWLTQLELKSTSKGKEIQHEVLVRGETANAGRLVTLFEDSQFFAQSGQRGPTTKIQPGPGEIFDLGAQIKSRAPPAPVTIAVADKPVEPVPAAVPPTTVTSPAGQPPPAAAPPPNAPPPNAPPPNAPPPNAPPASGSVSPPAAVVPPPGTAPPPPSAAMAPPPNGQPPGGPPPVPPRASATTGPPPLSPALSSTADPAKTGGSGPERKP